MSLMRNIIGTLENEFQVGIDGIKLANNSGTEGRLVNDSDVLAPLAVADPTSEDHATTRRYVRRRLVHWSFSFDGGDVGTTINPGDNTGKYGICHTSGGTYNAKQIYYDNGTTLEAVAHEEGRAAVNIGGDFTGTFSASEDNFYTWDTEGDRWVKVGPVDASAEGAMKVIRVVLGTNATYDSTASLPTNSVVHDAQFDVEVGYSVGTTVSLGTPTLPTLFMSTAENKPQLSRLYSVEQVTVMASSEVLRVTISNSPAAGSGSALIKFSEPLV